MENEKCPKCSHEVHEGKKCASCDCGTETEKED